MKNRHYLYFILLFVVQVCITGGVVRAEEERDYIDPGFKLLLKLYPRSAKIVNPMVPRISAQTALKLYNEGKAIFFSAGSELQPLIPGAIRITEPLIENPPIRFLKEHEDRIVVIYCQ